MYIKKQIKLSEIDIMRADPGFSKPKQRNQYKNLYERRKKMKTNYNITGTQSPDCGRSKK